MKILPFALTAVIAAASFNVLASQEINTAQAAQHQLIGNVSVSGVSGSTDDAVRALAKKADESNAPYFRIIALGNPGDSSDWLGNAQLYR